MGNCYMLIAVSVLARVTYGSQVITTSFGKNATLPCQIANQGSGLRSLYWKKDGTTIYSGTSQKGNGKYSVTDKASLAIPDVTESDAGNYSCIVAFRKPYGTITSDIMQLYVIEVSVSHCIDTGQEMDGCSCSINGSNISSLECSASGFPHPPVITWEEEDRIVYLSSSVDLTRIRENTTLTCKARDMNMKDAVENKTVCVYSEREVTSTGGSPVETTTASVNVRAYIAAIVVLFIALILLLLERYIRKKGKAFQWYKKRNSPKTLEEPDEPPLHGKDIGANDAGRVEYVLKETSNWKNSKESSVGDLPTSQPESTSIAGGTGDVDFPPDDCNQSVSIPMSARSNSMVPLNPRPPFLRSELQSFEISNAISQIILDVPVTGLSGLSGDSYLDCSTAMLLYLPMQSTMTPSMASSSVVACNQLSPALREELVRDLSERAAMSNTTSPIFLGFNLERVYSGLRGYICLNCSTVTWTSSVSEPVVQFGQEEDEIPDTPSTAKLLEDRCKDSEDSDNEHHDYMNT